MCVCVSAMQTNADICAEYTMHVYVRVTFVFIPVSSPLLRAEPGMDAVNPCVTLALHPPLTHTRARARTHTNTDECLCNSFSLKCSCTAWGMRGWGGGV